ncbi:hypothetical protein BpHYR1_025916 [Brachionus plicatilis]|uniref:Uncharacterized protein n=1 Tax=Brachionus plicatilis TaxID=10195 RepID=A0A3M7Q9P8_BRAPC|nr:hypothetical protein BpHYR1_025916 [Brachionus plicatilis]
MIEIMPNRSKYRGFLSKECKNNKSKLYLQSEWIEAEHNGERGAIMYMMKKCSLGHQEKV